MANDIVAAWGTQVVRYLIAIKQPDGRRHEQFMDYYVVSCSRDVPPGYEAEVAMLNAAEPTTHVRSLYTGQPTNTETKIEGVGAKYWFGDCAPDYFLLEKQNDSN